MRSFSVAKPSALAARAALTTACLEAVRPRSVMTQCMPQVRHSRRAVPTSAGQRQDRHLRLFAGDQQRGGAGLREAADRLDVGGLGDLAGGGDDAVGDGRLAARCGWRPSPRGRSGRSRPRCATLCIVCHRLDRIGAGGAFGRQHHRIGALVDRGGDVRDLGAGRHRAFDHLSSIWVATITGLAAAAGHAGSAASGSAAPNAPAVRPPDRRAPP